MLQRYRWKAKFEGKLSFMVLSRGPKFSRSTLKWWKDADRENDAEIGALLALEANELSVARGSR
jgi:hypothetical protein